jgi:hypothetical protein
MNLIKPSGLLLGLCLLTGCTQWHYDLGSPLSKADIPDAGQHMTLAQVLADLGPPQRISATSNGYVLAWEHWQIKEQTLGLSLGAMGAELFSIGWGDLQAKGEFLVVTFNRRHQLISSTFSQWDNNGGGGKSIQPFLGLVSVVDAGDLVGKMPQHRWGGAFLKPLPRALNRDSNSATGQNGIEQRGTPTAIGQQSLELN